MTSRSTKSMMQRNRRSIDGRLGVGLLLISLLSVAACSHASQAKPSTPPGPETAQRPSSPPVTTSPEGILSHDAVRALQHALLARGIAIEPTGNFDDATQAALRTFQSREGLAETGLPTLSTLRLLGLDAAAIYRTPSPAANGPGAKPNK